MKCNLKLKWYTVLLLFLPLIFPLIKGCPELWSHVQCLQKRVHVASGPLVGKAHECMSFSKCITTVILSPIYAIIRSARSQGFGNPHLGEARSTTGFLGRLSGYGRAMQDDGMVMAILSHNQLPKRLQTIKTEKVDSY